MYKYQFCSLNTKRFSVVVVVAMSKMNDSPESVPRYLQEWDEVIDELPTLVIQNKKKESPPDVVFVFLHGYGSNTRRTKKMAETVLNHSFLPPTSRFLQPTCTSIPTVRFLIPQAPHDVADGVFSWWKLPNIGLAASVILTGTRQLESYNPENDLQECRELMNSYLRRVQESYPDAILVLGGFSQGSLLAADLILTRSYYRKPDMVVLMSTTLIEKQTWVSHIEKHKKPLLDIYILQTHGVYDLVLAFSEAKKFFWLLSFNNKNVTEFYPFDSGHDMSLTARKHVAVQLETFVYEKLTMDFKS